MNYHYTKNVPFNFNDTLAKVKAEFSSEGFGILFEINMQEKFKAALNEDFRPYVILGACRPKNGFEAINEDAAMGTMLPCNVAVQQIGENECQVSIVNADVALSVVDNKEIRKIAEHITARIQNVIQNL